MPRRNPRQRDAARVTAPPRSDWLTVADVLRALGGVRPQRVRFSPPAGQATEKDLVRIQAHEKRHYELIDGILVEKIMGAPESCLTSDLDYALRRYLEKHD